MNALNHIENENKDGATEPSVQSSPDSEPIDGLQDSDGEYVDNQEDEQAEH